MQHLQMDPSFATRALNEGFSGGEKKRAEMLQLAMLKPRMAILDEPDSGLDIDAVRIVSDGINAVHQQQPEMGILLITHYQRILNYVTTRHGARDGKGRIVESGGAELVQQLESEGYDPILRRLGIEEAEEATDRWPLRPQDLTKDYKYGFSDPEQYAFKSRRGLDREIVEQISAYKNEPEWMLQFRLRALDIFFKKPMPTWPAADLERDRLPEHLLLRAAVGEQRREVLGRRPGVHQGHVRQARHPRGGAEVPGGRLGAVRVGGRLPLHPRGPGEAGRHLPGHGLRACASTRTSSRSTSARSSRPPTTSSRR